MSFWGRYVPVAERRAKALKKMNKLKKGGKNVQPVRIDGRCIARSFWGKGWCDHLESFSDYANRLPRGRTYVRNGSVCHLEIQPGRIEALVSGSSVYKVSIGIRKLSSAAWKALKKQCAGRIGSMLELLQGKLSNQVMAIVTDRKNGLFPRPGEIEFSCSCPDWADMCKHVAAVLYGVGSRLDSQPELLFLLRDVDPLELIAADFALPVAEPCVSETVLSDERLGDIFGVDLDMKTGANPSPVKASPKTRKPPRAKKEVFPVETRKRGRPSKKFEMNADPSGSKKPDGGDAAGKIEQLGDKPNIRPTGKSVARLRKKLGMSVAEFARRLGVSAASVLRWESVTGRLNLQSRPLDALSRLQREAASHSR